MFQIEHVFFTFSSMLKKAKTEWHKNISQMVKNCRRSAKNKYCPNITNDVGWKFLDGPTLEDDTAFFPQVQWLNVLSRQNSSEDVDDLLKHRDHAR